jgi:very-short-patch-repair endonuclease
MAIAISQRVQQKLDEWKRNLLLGDGRSNNLLRFRPSKSSMLRIKHPDAASIYGILQQQKSLTIPFQTEGDEVLDLLDPAFNDDGNNGQARLLTGPQTPTRRRRADDVIELEADATKLPSIMYRLRLKAQTALNERGVNVLFVAFGQLEWTETGDATEQLRSPLILVPVELNRETLSDPYKLRALDDDTILNPVLVERMRKDFEIDFNLDAEDYGNLALDDVCQRVRTAIAGRRPWRVQVDVAYVGLFSFLKMSMYKELESAAGVAANNVIIQRLAGEPVAMPVPAGIPDVTQLDDKIPPGDLYNILDADASQLEAITYVKAGGNVVIQGPPGTGKSQTIANCIAECMATNKSVLFVSEKMAALDVVYQRLAQVGLAEFCLEAHSHKANKREIIRQLGDALARRQGVASDGWASETLAGLQTTRERLNTYVRALHNRETPLRRSAYDLHGEIAVRQKAPVLPFSFPGVSEITPAKLAAIEEAVQEIVLRADVLRADAAHPWHGCTAPAYSLELRAAVLYHFGELHGYLLSLAEGAAALAAAIGMPRPNTLDQARSLNVVVTRAQEGQLPAWILLGGSDTPTATALAMTLSELSSVSPDQRRNMRRDRVLSVLQSIAPQATSTLQDNASTRDRTIDSLKRLGLASDRTVASQSAIQEHLGITEAPNAGGVHSITALVELLLRNPKSVPGWFNPTRLAYAIELARTATNHMKIWEDEGNTILQHFDAEIFSIAAALLARFVQSYTSVFRNVRPGYHRDMRKIRHLSKDGRKYSYSDALTMLRRASHAAESRRWLDTHQAELEDLLGPHYAGDRTDWSGVAKDLETTKAILGNRHGESPSDRLVRMASGDGTAQKQLGDLYRDLSEQPVVMATQIETLVSLLPWSPAQYASLDLPDLATFARNLASELAGLWSIEAEVQRVASGRQSSAFQTTLEGIERELGFLATIFPIANLQVREVPLAKAPLDEVVQWVQKRIDGIDDLDAWIAYRTAVQKIGGLGLTELIPLLRTSAAPAELWVDAAIRQIYHLCLDHLYQKQPVLGEFRGASHDSVLQRFRTLDRAIVELGSRRVRNNLLTMAPHLNGTPSESSELGILLREVGKRARHKPLRRLFAEIPTLLRALKPCLMMSPLSLSQYLDPERVRFDVVIFDEASQIRPEDAVGSIMRGAQVVVAGDERQLPPTSFFSSFMTESGEDWDEEAPEIYESILEACLSAGVTPKMLRWHYRSRDERLIAFSNRFIYDGRLITFPSAQQDESGRGVSLKYVPEGVYDRSGTRTNQVEATQIVNLIIEHAASWIRQEHQRSLGVVAFSEAQQLAILQILEKTRRDNPDLEAFFRERDNGEVFFVKNLENVQGDERDVIFFSVGYGRDVSGRLGMNFGPLNRQGGERRLNVAITRARYQVIVVSSITGADIDLTKSNAEGVRLLKRYLDYAEKGLSVLAQGEQTTVGDYESPFEKAVARALESKGLIVQPQIGCAGFRIDLGILHPDRPGHYVLGVECDGATYHGQATARDRDRLRQQVLEGLGWRIHRIWSRDWVHAPVREIEKVVEAYQNAMTGEDRDTCEATVIKPRTVVADITERATQQPAGTPQMPIALAKRPPPATPYRAARLPRRGSKEQFYKVSANSLVDPIAHCVREEGPVSAHIVRQRVAACWEIQRVGDMVSAILDDAINRAVKRGLIRQRGEFLWPPEMTTPPVRSSGEGVEYRPISEVCPEEIDSAILLVLEHDFASAREALIVAVARLLGYDRAKRVVSERIDQRIEALQAEEKLRVNGDQVSLSTIGRAKVG